MTMRYVQMYATGATGRLAEFAQKKYRGHRCLPESWHTELVDGYRAKYGRKSDFLEDMEALEKEIFSRRRRRRRRKKEQEEENPSAAEDPDAEWVEEEAIEENDSEEEEQVQSRRSARNNFGCKYGKSTEFNEESDDMFDDELDGDQ